MNDEEGTAPVRDVEPRMPTLGASEIERVVVLYYGRDGSRAGFEFTGVREVVLETRRDVDTDLYVGCYMPPQITDEEHELTVTASRRRGLVYSPDSPRTPGREERMEEES